MLLKKRFNKLKMILNNRLIIFKKKQMKLLEKLKQSNYKIYKMQNKKH